MTLIFNWLPAPSSPTKPPSKPLDHHFHLIRYHSNSIMSTEKTIQKYINVANKEINSMTIINNFNLRTLIKSTGINKEGLGVNFTTSKVKNRTRNGHARKIPPSTKKPAVIKSNAVIRSIIATAIQEFKPIEQQQLTFIQFLTLHINLQG